MSVRTDRDDGLLIYGGFALSLAVVIAICKPWNLTDHFMVGAPFGRDFVNYWMGGRLALDGRLDVLVDLRAYNALIVERFGHTADDFFVFSYPPSLLPVLLPFGALPYVPALTIWTAINLALLAWSVRLIAADRRPMIAACLAPATLTMVVYGQFSGVMAALVIAAITRGARRPLLAGLCLALISVKPQLAAVVGLLMLLIGQWRAVAWSVPGAAAVAGLPVLLFGLAPWENFFHVTMPFHVWLFQEFIPDHLRTLLSIYAAARLEGMSFIAAQAVQMSFGFAVVAGAVLLTRRDGLNPRTLTLLLLAGIAALAYFQHYDLAIVAPALAVALFGSEQGERPDQRRLLSFIPASLLWLAPPLAIHQWPIINLVVAGVLVIGLLTQWRVGGGANSVPACAISRGRGSRVQRRSAASIRCCALSALLQGDEARIAAEHPRYEPRGSHEGPSLRREAVVIVGRPIDVARCHLLAQPAADLVPFTHVALGERQPELFGRQRRWRFGKPRQHEDGDRAIDRDRSEDEEGEVERDRDERGADRVARAQSRDAQGRRTSRISPRSRTGVTAASTASPR